MLHYYYVVYVIIKKDRSVSGSKERPPCIIVEKKKKVSSKLQMSNNFACAHIPVHVCVCVHAHAHAHAYVEGLQGCTPNCYSGSPWKIRRVWGTEGFYVCNLHGATVIPHHNSK